MITLKLLKDIFGEEGEKYFEYLGNRNRGGINNSKGNTFENYFTVYEIAKCFNQNEDWDNTLFSSQMFCFIDDLVIEHRKDKKIRHYQIKDVKSLDWHSGRHPIKDDFKWQYEISLKEGVEPFLRLVVSHKDVHDHLIADIPEEIADLVEIVHFETASSLNNLIRKNPLIHAVLVDMCALENPATDKLEALGTILLGVWDSTDKKNISLKDVLDKSYALNPNYIKGFSTDISEKLNRIFKSVKGFSYMVENGFLSWNFNSTDEGVLAYRIGSMEFEQWENNVFNAEATFAAFEDLEPFLVS